MDRPMSKGTTKHARKTMKMADDAQLDSALYMWFIQRRSEGVPLSGPMVMEKALLLNSKLGGNEDFKASSGWLEKFKHRHGLRQLYIEGEKLSSNSADAQQFVEQF